MKHKSRYNRTETISYKVIISIITEYILEIAFNFEYNLNGGDNMVRRDYYINELLKYKDKPIIKILTGLRRV